MNYPHIPIWFVIVEAVSTPTYYYDRLVDVIPTYLDKCDEVQKQYLEMYQQNTRLHVILIGRETNNPFKEFSDAKAEKEHPGYLPGD